MAVAWANNSKVKNQFKAQTPKTRDFDTLFGLHRWSAALETRRVEATPVIHPVLLATAPGSPPATLKRLTVEYLAPSAQPRGPSKAANPICIFRNTD
ncbi:unnamed protein product [Parascedosporium putredinis]|uniref:Uncharacterized protein n=1 Tax=Parascedosporium putredinis TaxID=1442378 RepID=A0A9P1M9N8_9PEZI|nr:unnamed protein product [Parascedosporium putredinis]CAI7991157.1 unnamed protein product [Parascedosporium putredinis]